jgi:hypothetical protein
MTIIDDKFRTKNQMSNEIVENFFNKNVKPRLFQI